MRGDVVDYWCDVTKGQERWRGPARVAAVDDKSDMVFITSGGRLIRRHWNHVRLHHGDEGMDVSANLNGNKGVGDGEVGDGDKGVGDGKVGGEAAADDLVPPPSLPPPPLPVPPVLPIPPLPQRPPVYRSAAPGG